MHMSKDIKILSSLGEKIKTYSLDPINEERRGLWRAINSLKPVRPMVMIDQIPWHEMNYDGSLDLKCTDPYCRELEQELRRTIFRWEHMPADMVIDPYINIKRPVEGNLYGMPIQQLVLETDKQSDVQSHYYLDQLKDEEDIEKLSFSPLKPNEKREKEIKQIAHAAFDGIIDIRMEGYTLWYTNLDQIGSLHGMENLLYDLIDRPDFIHKLVKKFNDNFIKEIDNLERNGLLGYHLEVVHCSGGYYDWVDAPIEEGKLLSAKNTWTFGASQIFSTVSPEMHNEFDIEYSKDFYSRFGLVNYGCCEPLDKKINIIRRLPNVRKISISPWADVKNAAQQIGGDYIITNKPNPAYFATKSFDAEVLMKELKDRIDICKNTGTPIEFIQKDISTVNYKPQRLFDWEKAVMRLVKGKE